MSKDYYDLLFPKSWDDWEPRKCDDKWYKNARKELNERIQAEAGKIEKAHGSDDLMAYSSDKLHFGPKRQGSGFSAT
jgi:hypothetical protein